MAVSVRTRIIRLTFTVAGQAGPDGSATVYLQTWAARRLRLPLLLADIWPLLARTDRCGRLPASGSSKLAANRGRGVLRTEDEPHDRPHGRSH
jgi:hypothetical protein